MTDKEVIEILNLVPLPGEGGFFRETYRSLVPAADGHRSAATAIYYLITPTTYSSLHRLPQDEVFHFYSGDPAEMLLIDSDGHHQLLTLGPNLAKNQRPQIVVPAGTWQGTRLGEPSVGYALLGTTVAPGFEFSDLELGQRSQLIQQFPKIAALIERYTVEI